LTKFINYLLGIPVGNLFITFRKLKFIFATSKKERRIIVGYESATILKL
jgi:hypothetical protein